MAKKGRSRKSLISRATKKCGFAGWLGIGRRSDRATADEQAGAAIALLTYCGTRFDSTGE